MSKKGYHTKRAASSGFTLIELVVVMVVLGVLATGTFQFIRYSMDIYQMVNARSQTIADSRFIISRLSRELDNALPSSVRFDNSTCSGDYCSCVEFMPLLASGRYLTRLRDGSGDETQLVVAPPWDEKALELLEGNASRWPDIRLVISPPSQQDLYDDYDAVTPSWATLDSWQADSSGLALATVSEEQAPLLRSPGERYYLVLSPVTYCAVRTPGASHASLLRYAGYGFDERTSRDSGVLMAERLQPMARDGKPTSDVLPFSITQSSNSNPPALRFDFAFSTTGQSDGELIRFDHEVHLVNAL